MIKLGIEQEFVFKNRLNEYIDFENADFTVFKNIIDQLPVYENDRKYFLPKSTNLESKRWYIEGFERFNDSGEPIMTIPKAIEIRTTPHESIDDLVEEFCKSFNKLMDCSNKFGLEPVLNSYLPYNKNFNIASKLSSYELSKRTKKEFEFVMYAMKSHGMHLNISLLKTNLNKLNEIAEKLAYYLPALISFSFSSPFKDGKLFYGCSHRSYIRSIKNTWKIVSIRHINNVPMIELKAFDTIGSKTLLKELLLLVRCIILNDKLKGSSKNVNEKLVQRASLVGFNDQRIRAMGQDLVNKTNTMLGSSKNTGLITQMLRTNYTFTHKIKEKYLLSNNIVESISNLYEF